MSGVEAAQADEARTPISPDGMWWWDGSEWKSTFSDDRRYRFDGRKWIPVRARFSAPRWSIIVGAIWLACLIVWFWVSIGIQFPHPNAPGGQLDAELRLLSGAALATILWGGVLGVFRRRGVALVGWLAGTGVLGVSYVGLIFAQPDADNQNDHVAAAGLVILGVPASVILFILIGVGFAIGAAARRLLGSDFASVILPKIQTRRGSS
jgi:hypothetical protein